MAKKREQKSIASLIGKREINVDEIDKAVEQVHQKQGPKQEATPPPKTQRKSARPRKAPAKKPVEERKVRVSVDTPQSLYLLAKGAALEEGITALKDFYLMCIQEHLKRKGKL